MIPQIECPCHIICGQRRFYLQDVGLSNIDAFRTNENATNHMPSKAVVLAVLGSLSLEFTRLSQITGNDKYFDGIQRVMNELEKWQNNTQIPGMWPATVDSSKTNETSALGSLYENSDEVFTLGAMADSTYEYLPKVLLFFQLDLEPY